MTAARVIAAAFGLWFLFVLTVTGGANSLSDCLLLGWCVASIVGAIPTPARRPRPDTLGAGQERQP